MRRYGFILLFVLVLISPFVLKRAMGTDDDRRVRSKQAPLRLVIVTPHVEGIKREFADAFSDWHERRFGQPVTVDYRVYGGGNEIVRFLRSSEGLYSVDLVWGGGTYLFDTQLKRGDFLEPLQLSEDVMRRAYPSSTLNGTRLHDDAPSPRWFGAALSAFGIVFNKDVLRYLDLPEPKRWSDLSHAKLGGWFIAADPTRSASARQAFMIVIERAMIDAAAVGRSEDEGWANGMGLIRLICSNARYFTDAALSTPGVIASGDAAAGMAIDFMGRQQVNAVGEDRIGYVEPVGETALDADPIAMGARARNREVGVRFIEYLLSDEGQRLWITTPGAPGGPRRTALRRLPIARDVYRDQTNFTDHVNPFDEGFAFTSSPSRTRTFAIVGELIEASCMSLLDELRDTRAAIERSSRRDELRAKLGRFPFDQSEALRRAAAFEKASALEKLEMKRRWVDEFRGEYEALQVEALQGH